MYSQVRGLSHNIYIVFSIEMNRWCEYMEDVYAKIDSLKAEQKKL